ncbi:MAG: HAD family hydrolase [Pseudomonadota bacterium]
MTALAKPRGILFDKDGTLFDFARTWEVWAAAFLVRLSGSAERAISAANAIGFDMEAQCFRAGSVVIAGTPDEVAQALAPEFPHLDHAALIDVLNEEAMRAPQAETVTLAPYLAGLRKRGFRLGVATNDAEVPARVHLSEAGVEHAFDFIAGFDSGHGAKPAPGQLLAFAKAVDLPPGACVMVGDSAHDLLAGQAAGMRCVGVLTGLATTEALAPLADVVLTDIGALPDWLAQF